MSIPKPDPYVSVKWQEGLAAQGGRNGAQPEDVIRAVRDRIHELDEKVPSLYNLGAICFLQNAIACIEQRERDRKRRGVEGTDKP